MNVELFHVYGRTDSHYETNPVFSKLYVVPNTPHSVIYSMEQGPS
jgi:hypothetical protein